MLPGFRQRVLVTVAVIGCGLLFLWAGRAAVGPDGQGGPTLVYAINRGAAITALAAACAAALAAGLIASAVGNRLAGWFVFGAAFGFAALAGGRIDPWLSRADLPGGYGMLLLETIVWSAVLGVVSLAIGLGRDQLRRRLPKWIRCATYEEAEAITVAGEQVMLQGAAVIAVAAVGIVIVLMPAIWIDFLIALVGALAAQALCWAATIGYEMLTNGKSGERKIEPPEMPGMLGGAVAVIVGALLTLLILRTANIQQVFFAVFIGFTLAGLVAHQMFPTTRYLAIVLSPLAVAVGAYACLWVYSYDSAAELLGSLYQSRGLYEGYQFISLGLARPAMYASIGVAGAALGVGWSQAMFAKRHHLVTVAE